MENIRTSERKKKRSPEVSSQLRRKIAVSIFSFIFALIMIGGLLAWKVTTDIGKTMDKVYQQVDTINMRETIASDESAEEGEASAEAEEPEEKEQEAPVGVPAEDMHSLVQDLKPMSILLIGTDTGDFSREAKNGLSDALIYCVLNPEKESVSLLSIPRDTYAEIVGKGFKSKINAAYSYGGAQMCINSVQNLLQLPVDAYAAVNLAGFQDIVDALGGITVENPFEFSQDEFTFPAGKINLTGEKALAYCRMRKADPEGDFGRSRRQRQVTAEIAKKAISLSGAMNYQSILDVIADNIVTNIDLDSAKEMLSGYEVCLKNINNYDTLKGRGMKDNGWFYVLDEEDLNRVTSELREELGL